MNEGQPNDLWLGDGKGGWTVDTSSGGPADPSNTRDSAGVTTLDANKSFRVILCINGESPDTVFENLLIRGGVADVGGGIACTEASSPTLINCHFQNNRAELAGGGAYNGLLSSPNYIDCVFVGNTCQFGDGGGMHSAGSFEFQNFPSAVNCVFRFNSAIQFGGGMSIAGSAVAILGCSFESNIAGTSGGGIHINPAGYLLATDSSFCANDPSQLDGFWDDNGGNCFSTVCDTDLDGTIDCEDLCPLDSNKIEPGQCGCNVPDTDTDEDGTADCNDGCPTDPLKIVPGQCGCNTPDTDSDGDGLPDCIDPCPMWPYECLDEGLTLVVTPATPMELAISVVPDGGTIEVAAGTYLLSETLDPTGRPMTIRGAVDALGEPTAILDGQGLVGVFRCVSGEGPGTVLENLVLANGAGEGAGMVCRDSSPVIRNCHFLQNISPGFGGGMLNDDGANPTVEECVFRLNSALYGGAIANLNASTPQLDLCLVEANEAGSGGGLYNLDSNPIVNNVIITGNLALNFGGGMSNVNSLPVINSCTISGNTADSGGGFAGNPVSNPRLAGTLVCENTPDNFLGSWIDEGANCVFETCDNDDDGVLDCEDPCPDWPYDCSGDGEIIIVGLGESIAQAMAAVPEGGVIQLAPGVFQPDALLDPMGRAMTIQGAIGFDGGPLTTIDGQGSVALLQCVSGETETTVFENLLVINGLGEGAGIRCTGSSPLLVNCRFEGHSSAGYGGAMRNDAASSPRLVGCVFAGNSASYGGAIGNLDDSNATLEDCLLVGNTALSGGAMYNLESDPQLVDCILEDNIATDYGGAVSNFNGSPSFLGCRISGNTAQFGGGLACSPESLPEFTESTVCDNTPENVFGNWLDGGDNCVVEVCTECLCDADLNGNGIVDGEDLGLLFAAWGPCGGSECPADLTDDGLVDGQDLGLLFASWGSCSN